MIRNYYNESNPQKYGLKESQVSCTVLYFVKYIVPLKTAIFHVFRDTYRSMNIISKSMSKMYAFTRY